MITRRQFTTLALAATAGAAIAVAFTSKRFRSADSNEGPVAGSSTSGIEIERQLLRLHDPDYADATSLFADVVDYPSALSRLTGKGIVVDGQVNPAALTGLRRTDPVLEYKGWQYLEFELLLFLAAHYLVKDHLPEVSEKLPFSNFEILDGTDFYGEALASLKTSSDNDFVALTQCLMACEAEPLCRRITLGKPDNALEEKRNMCWLTSDRVEARSDPGYFGAIRRR